MAEEIRGPIPPDYHYERVVDGVVVETISGTGGAAGSGLAGLGTTTIDDAGNVQAPPIRRADPVSAPPPGDLLGEPLSGGVRSDGSFDTGSTTYSRNTNYSSGRSGGGSYGGSSYRGSGGYSSGGYSGSGGSGYGGGDGGYSGPTVPKYADGSVHPFFGGPPRIPGGQFAAQSQESGSGGQKQVYVPGGAAAGYDTHAAPTPQGGNGGSYGGGSSGGGSGGGGGGASDLYYKLKAKLTGGGSSSSDTTTTQEYRRQGRRADKAYDKYNEELYNPDPLPVHGWAKQQGFKPGSVELALDDPTTILSSVFPGYERRNTNAGTWFDDIPMVDLALAAEGTGKRGLMTDTPVAKVPHILKQQGVKPVKPDDKKMLDPSAVVNTMAPMYDIISRDTGGGGTWFDTNALLGNLANAKKHSAVGQQITNAFEENPGAAQQQAIRLVQSVLGTGPMNAGTAARMQMVEQAASNLGASTMRRKPKKATQYLNSLAGSFLE